VLSIIPAASTVDDVIAGYRPRMPEAAGVFARATVAAVGPSSPARAKALLWSCARLATFGVSVGLEPSAVVLLHPSVIERFILVGTGELSGAARRTLRTNLGHVAARVSAAVAPVALSRERAKTGYTDAQIAAYLGLADAQPTLARRMRAQGLICLGAGAGLMGADLRRARGHDVMARSGGVVVTVTGRRPRVVPVLGRFHDRVVASASFAQHGWMIGGVDPDRHNVTTPLISSFAGGADLGRLDTGRLRATWLAAVADRLGIKAFMEAAGITCSQRLGDLVAGLASPTEADAVALLGARR
jgi:integrase